MLAWLLQCAAPHPEQARTGRLLAGLLLIFSTVLLVSAGILVLSYGFTAGILVNLVDTMLLLGLYWINRRGGVTVAAVSTIAFLLGMIALWAIQPQSNSLALELLPTVLIVPVALAGVLLVWWVVPLTTGVAIVEVIWLYNTGSIRSAIDSTGAASDLFVGQLVVIILLLTIGAVATFSRHQIEESLAQLRRQNGDLSSRSNHEQTLLRQMQQTSTHISHSASEIAAAAGQQAGNAAEQAVAIEQVTSTMEELNQTAQQIAVAAASVASAAELALRSAQDGQEAVRDSIVGMAGIKGRINEIVDRNLSLAAQSQRISEILDVITSIAAQTHILALNAAVESAGAGEHGQRFAVVAAEVKKLAQRSVHATKEVQTVVSQVQGAIAAAVMATEEGLKEGDHGVRLAHQSGEANEAIIALIEHTAQLANAISLATQQQRTASEQVVTTMHEIGAMTHQAAVGSRQTQTAVAQLHEAAQGLGELALEELSSPPPVSILSPPPQSAPTGGLLSAPA
jgi:methyl-accepting chemotaxis protein